MDDMEWEDFDFSTSQIEALIDNQPGEKRKRQDSENSEPPRKRIPGPVGNLPDLQPEEIRVANDASNSISTLISNIVSTVQPVPSPSLINVNLQLPISRSNTWRELHYALGLNREKGLTDHLCFQVLQKLAKKLPSGATVPYVAGIIEKGIEKGTTAKSCRLKNPTLKLRDSSSTMVAALTPSLAQEHGSKLVTGSCIAFKNCGILRMKNTTIITASRKNLVCITTEVDPGKPIADVFSAIGVDAILNDYGEMKRKTEQAHAEECDSDGFGNDEDDDEFLATLDSLGLLSDDDL